MAKYHPRTPMRPHAISTNIMMSLTIRGCTASVQVLTCKSSQMKKHSTHQTKKIIKDTAPAGSKLRRELLKLKVGESVTLHLNNWPFKSEPAEYLYTMRRLKRTYSYRTMDMTGEILIYRTS